MASEIRTLTQSIAVSDVGDVVVTPIIQEGAIFVREIRIFGAAGSEGSVPVFIMRISGASADAVNLKTPELTF